MYRASVIIPVYNAEKTLARCVESILFGKERNIEILLIDDRSKDGSWELCCAYAEKYENVRAFRNETNRGVSYTRNRGLDEATGEYILFVDSDDWVTDSFAAALCDGMDKYPGCLVMCAYRQVNDKACQNTKTVRYASDDQISKIAQKNLFELMDLELIHYVWNKVLVCDTIRDMGIRFDENQFMGEDLQFVLDYYRAMSGTKCIVINQPCYNYARYNPNSLVSRWSEIGNLEQGIDRICQLAELTGEKELGKKKVREFKSSFVYHIVRDKRLASSQKIRNIELVMQDGKAVKYYIHQWWVCIKEQIAEALKGFIK